MKFLVIGDAMVDVYWVGGVRRLNPEKHSSPLVSVRNKLELPGGAANVARNLEAMGAEVVLASGLGEIFKHRVIDDDGVICRFDVEDELSPVRLPDGEFEAVLISDYAKGSINPAVALDIKKKYGNAKFFVDTKAHPAPWINKATCLFPNSSEFEAHAYDYKCSKLVLVKQGKFGATFYRSGLRSETFNSTAAKVFSVVGAGDTVLAAFALAYMRLDASVGHGMDVAAARFSMDVASMVVEHELTYAPTLPQFFARLGMDKYSWMFK